MSEPVQPMAPATAARPRPDGTAVVAFVCAILSWLLFPVVLAIVALVLVRDRGSDGPDGPDDFDGTDDSAVAVGGGRGLVTATKWVAWLNLLVGAMGVAFVASFVIALWIGR